MADAIGRGDYSKSLKRAFGLTGRTPYVLGSEVVPVSVLNDLDAPPFHSKQGYCRWATAGPVGTDFARIQIFVPDDQGFDTLIRVVRYILVRAATGASIFATIYPAVLSSVQGTPGAPLSGFSWDQGGKGLEDTLQTSAPCVGGYTHAGGPSYDGLSIVLVANTTVKVDGPFVLRRGACLEVCNTQINSLIAASFYWDDYIL